MWSLLLGRERKDKTSYSDDGELHLMSEGENRRALRLVLVVFLNTQQKQPHNRRWQQRQLDSLVFFPSSLLFFTLSVIPRRFSLLLHYAFIDKSMFFHSIRTDEDFLVKTINNEQYSFTLVRRLARTSS